MQTFASKDALSLSDSQVNYSFPLNSFLFCSVVSFIMPDSWPHYLCPAFSYQQNPCTWMRNCFLSFFFLLNKFSHRINDRRRLIFCFQYRLFFFSSPGSIFEPILFLDVLTGMMRNWKDWCTLYWPAFPLIKDVPTNLSFTGQTKARGRETMPDGVQETIPTDTLCFVGCFQDYGLLGGEEKHTGIPIPSWAKVNV